MSRSNGFAVRPALLAGFLAIAAAAPAMAQETSGLGSAFPQTQNISTAPGYAVYRFVRDDVTYLQVNTATGQVLGAIATANSHYLALPIGTAVISTPERPQIPLSASAIKIYDDGTTQITMASVDDQKRLQVTVKHQDTAATSPHRVSKASFCVTCGVPLQQAQQ